MKVLHKKLHGLLLLATELPRSIAKSKPLSLNWAKGDEHCEILNGETGQVILSQNNRYPPPPYISSSLCVEVCVFGLKIKICYDLLYIMSMKQTLRTYYNC